MHFITILGLGFLLGARHALDADHLVAVSTILCRYRDPRAPGLIGFCWGFGHTVVLLMVGCAVIVLKVTIPEPLALALEFWVGVMLVMLGAFFAYTIWRERWHLHAHQHAGGGYTSICIVTESNQIMRTGIGFGTRCNPS